MKNEIKERPILYSAPMIRAKLAGIKTQTRRMVKHVPSDTTAIKWVENHETMPNGKYTGWVIESGCPLLLPRKCPFGKVGDRLYGKEKHFINRDSHDGTGKFLCYYAADYTPEQQVELFESEDDKWRPSIHMFREHSRILDEIVEIRVERVQDIGEANAIAEGVAEFADMKPMTQKDIDGMTGQVKELAKILGVGSHITARYAYQILWDSINGKGSWESNPWVWVIVTKSVKP